MRQLQYPIGEFQAPEVIGDDQLAKWIEDIEGLPADLRRAVEGLDDDQLDTRYRPDGWTVRQVVHHVADSHLNSIIRFKWTLTEDRPTIKPYFEDRWAELADYRDVPVGLSLDLIEALHRRWVAFLRTLRAADLDCEFVHPETGKSIALRVNVGVYAWHGRHHLAHIEKLVEREGWR